MSEQQQDHDDGSTTADSATGSSGGDDTGGGGNGLLAHIVTANAKTASLIQRALEMSGIGTTSIHWVAIPPSTPVGSSWHYPKGGTYFEVVMRLFRFENQTLGKEYLSSNPPVFYIKGNYYDEKEHDQTTTLSEPIFEYYKDRSHPDNINEKELLHVSFNKYGHDLISNAGRAFRRDFTRSTTTTAPIPHDFNPLMIRGLDCLKNHTNCLGVCPDAAYFGPNIQEHSDDIPLFQLDYPHQFHIVTLVDHKAMNTSIYSSVTILKPQKKRTNVLSKAYMNVRATRLGITSYDFEEKRSNKRKRIGTCDGVGNEEDGKREEQELLPPQQDSDGPLFISWVFTRNPVHCDRLASAVDGCTVIEASDVPIGGHMTYCERVYLNPRTGLGPDWETVLPARLYKFDLDKAPFRVTLPSEKQSQKGGAALLRSRIKPIPVKVYDGNEPFRLLHIIKTGGEALQNYLDTVTSPKYSFQTCRSAAITAVVNNNINNASIPCFAAASFISSVLCGLNCECCAKDIIQKEGGGFHGTLIRSPRAHALSLFTHGHQAHNNITYRKIASDVTLYLAEGALRLTEHACGSYCTGSSSDFREALEGRLLGTDPSVEVEEARPLRVLPLENTQSHALTCSKSEGSLGHHFRIKGVDSLEPNTEDALLNLHQMEWVGVTDLMEPSLCLLHYQANGSLPSVCECEAPQRWEAHRRPLGYWREQRYKRRSLDSLSSSEAILSRLDEHTRIDRKVFVKAVHLLLGRLKYVEEVSGSDILSCIDWNEFHRATEYVWELWEEGGEGFDFAMT